MVTLHVPDARERDIDLLLLEEFVASPHFSSWFLAQINVLGADSVIEARRSVRTDTGESDLEITFGSQAGRILVLIENKVDQSFQPTQPQRYAERAKRYESSSKYAQVVTVLIAPQSYFGEGEDFGFDAIVSYEMVQEWFRAADLGKPRTDYKCSLLQTAIDRGRMGWQPVPHEAVSRFWQSYWQLAMTVAPQLSMPPPKEQVPGRSNFVFFRPAALPVDVRLKHKVGAGHVDLEFRGKGDQLADLYAREGGLPPGAKIKTAGKSAVVRCYVDPVDMTHEAFSERKETIAKGIGAAAILLEWYRKEFRSPNTD